jgi:hypothetical protein
LIYSHSALVVKQQIADFKLKVIDLLSVMSRNAPTSPLFLEIYIPLLQSLSKIASSLARNNSEEKQRVYDRLYKFYHTRLVGEKIKHNPQLSTKEAIEKAYDVLEELYSCVGDIKDPSVLNLASRVNLALLKSLHQAPSSLLSTNNKKKQKKQVIF